MLARSSDDPGNMVVVGDEVYWTTFTGGEVWRVGRSGGEPERLLSNDLIEWYVCCGLAADAEYLYFSRTWYPDSRVGRTVDTLVRMSQDGSDVTELVQDQFVNDIGVDDEFVYFTGTIKVEDSLIDGVFRLRK